MSEAVHTSIHAAFLKYNPGGTKEETTRMANFLIEMLPPNCTLLKHQSGHKTYAYEVQQLRDIRHQYPAMMKFAEKVEQLVLDD